MFKRFIYLFSILISFISLFYSSKLVDNKLYFPIHKKNYYISSPYGYRTLEYYHFHNGVDIPLIEGTRLYAMSYGVVSFLGFTSGYGNCIIIKYNNGYKSLYGHISPKFVVKVGDSVSPKQLVAYVGPKYLPNGKLNGFTTGPHFHFTLYKNDNLINPLSVEYN